MLINQDSTCERLVKWFTCKKIIVFLLCRLSGYSYKINVKSCGCKLAIIRGSNVLCCGIVCTLCIGCQSKSELTIETLAEHMSKSESKSSGDFEEIEHDFGLVFTGEKVSHHFKLQNHSTQNWEIVKISTSCSCTVGKVSSTRIPPGASSIVEVEYTAPNVPTNDSRHVDVHFKKDLRSPVMLSVFSTVRDPITIDPANIEFNKISGKHSLEKFLDVINYSDTFYDDPQLNVDVDWVDIALSPVDLSVDTEKIQASMSKIHQAWRMRVVFDREAPLEDDNGDAEIRLEFKGAPRQPKPIKVSYSLEQPINLTPKQAFFGTLSKKGTGKTTLLMSTSEDIILSESDIRISSQLEPNLKWNLERSSSQLWKLEFELRPGNDTSAGELLKGDIEVSFSDPEFPKLSIPVFARVSE